MLAAHPSHRRPRRLPRWLPLAAGGLIAAAILTAAFLHFARGLDPAAIRVALAALPAGRLVAAVGLTAASYVLLAGYDALALASLDQKVPWPTILRASFTSYAISHNLGLGLVTGGSARLVLYRRAGVAPAMVARVVVIASGAFWCGVAGIAAGALLFHARPLALFGVVLSPVLAHACGAAVIALLASLPFAGRVLGGTRLALPGRPGHIAGLLATAVLDLALSVGALLVLVPSLGPEDFPQLFLAYALAVVAGLVTHVPGGLGVFEGTVLAALNRHGPELAAGLIAYRAIYYLLPLALSLALNGALALRATCRRGGAVGRALAVIAFETAPMAMAAMVFTGGLILLLSGVLPAVHDRLRTLRAMVALPVVEAAHLAASLTGAALLLVAPALLSRSRSGFATARALLLVGALFSLAKGLDFEEAGLMLAMAGALHGFGAAFYRQSLGAFSSHNRVWLAAAMVAVIAAVVSGFATYPRMTLVSDPWFHFGWRADLSRYLRASFATCALMAAFAVRELLSRPPVLVGLTALPEAVFAAATAQSGRSDAMLALTGDKRFLVAPQGDAFLMFRPLGRTWFVMGDPVGHPARWADLVWELRRQSDRVGTRLCFYQIGDAFLPLALELGLRPVKYGEEALISLDEFTLSGSCMKGLRNSHAQGARSGLALELVPRARVPEILGELRCVSEAWLARHGGREKRFSLGAFDPAYLARCDMAVVRGAGGEAVAFANLWRSGDGAELSVDLMRQRPEAPAGTMDFLLVELMESAKKQHFARFNLGVAPLSGMRGGRLATPWTRGARFAFGFSRLRYNFQGLRRYKEKFAPAWHNRYIALPHGLAGYRALIQLLRLIGR
ncbi:bifunctional lysylphosphatidylglycerol flippase/synthetase MprF [Novosphingobium bradum]|uniref:Phosphatidylglycerol lysyltransferase n=1 Tax=Novosphingobium bradum TaxID=1737444 RepID=A0ABV7IUZ5_9SPHN